MVRADQDVKITGAREEGLRVGSCLVVLCWTVYILGHLYLSMLLEIDEIVIYSSLFPVAGRLNMFGKDMVVVQERLADGSNLAKF